MKTDEQKQMELQFVNQQILQLQEHLQLLDQELAELSLLAESLDELGKKETKLDVLVPLGAGIYIPGSIENTKQVIVSVGSKIAVEKSIEESKKLIEEQSKAIRINVEKAGEDLNTMSTYGQMLQDDTQK